MNAINATSTPRLTNHNSLLKLILSHIRELLAIILIDPLLLHRINFTLRHQMHGTTTPSGTGQSAAVRACTPRELAQLIQLWTAVLVDLSARVLRVVHQLAERFQELFVLLLVLRRWRGE